MNKVEENINAWLHHWIVGEIQAGLTDTLPLTQYTTYSVVINKTKSNLFYNFFLCYIFCLVWTSEMVHAADVIPYASICPHYIFS